MRFRFAIFFQANAHNLERSSFLEEDEVTLSMMNSSNQLSYNVKILTFKEGCDEGAQSCSSDCATQTAAQQSAPVYSKEISSQRRSGVSFNPSVRVRLTLSVDHYSNLEIETCWYTAEEYERMRRRSMKIVHMMVRKPETTRSRYCTRGLEHLTPFSLRGRQVRHENFYNAVLLRERSCDGRRSTDRDCCDLVLAAQCTMQMVSRQSMRLALERAAQDVIAAA